MNTTALPVLPTAVVTPPRVLERLTVPLATVGVLTLAGDFLLWEKTKGLGLAIFFFLLGVAMLLRGAHSWRAWMAFALLAASCAQAAVGFCLTNVCATLLLLAVLLGETRFAVLPAGAARWIEGALAWLRAPGRWFWLLGQSFATERWQGEGAGRAGDALARWWKIGAPALLLTVVFTITLAQGNAILRDGLNRFGAHFGEWLQHFDFSFGRVFLWLFLGTLALVVARPPNAPAAPRSFTRVSGVWQRAEAQLGYWQSALVLGVLNALFFIVNTIDAAYLWRHGKIPEGVSAYDYIHAGTNSLIVTTILSALVLSAIFQQQPEISRRGSLRLLGHLWIVQNLVLLASVALRLKLYVEQYHLLTAKRIHLGCFLALVALGFLFLVLHLERGPDLRRLLWRNAAAAFALIFTLQFVNTTGLAAQWNVQRWATVPNWGLDYNYLLVQGPDAWPALARVAQAESGGEISAKARAEIERLAALEKTRLAALDWRERQFRRDTHAAQVIAAAATPAL